MKQKDVYLVDFEPIVGHEQGGVRPAIVVSGNAMNDNSPLIWVIPLTSKLKNYIFDLKLDKTSQNGLKEDSEALVFQLRAISKNRLTSKIGEISDNDLRRLMMKINEIVLM